VNVVDRLRAKMGGQETKVRGGPNLLKSYADGTEIWHRPGNFDDYYVWVKSGVPELRMDRDVEYLRMLKEFGKAFGLDEAYDDFVRVYKMVGTTWDDALSAAATSVSKRYGGCDDVFAADVMFSVLGAAMVSEEQSRLSGKAPNGKRAKRLAVYQVLKDGMDPEEAANCSRHKSHFWMDKECRSKGF
jgi:hypothetical protein